MAGKKVLVVDDDTKTVDLVKLYLNRDGYRVVTAYEGEEALRLAREAHPDLIVLDIMMPDKDGYVVCKELKADPKYRSIPILLLTAVVSRLSTTRYTQLMGMETEADDYVDKPVEPAELVRRIEVLLSK